MSLYPIGFFDSGVGGITLWKSIKSLLPDENTIYLSDSKNCPYGVKSQVEIDKICFNNTNFLIEKKCKIIVVACNTATTNSISRLRDKFKIPFVGIEPAIKPATLKTKTKKIGVLATKGTLMSSLFAETSSDHQGDVKFIKTEGVGLVELIENGDCEKDINLLLIKYLKPMLEKGIDQLVLGCTHYSLIKKLIKKIIGDKVNIIDCNRAVALQTKKILELNNLLNTNKKDLAQHYFFNSGQDNFTIEKVLENEYKIFKFES